VRSSPWKRTSGPLGIYDGVDAPPTASTCQSGDVEHHLREASVSEVTQSVWISPSMFFAPTERTDGGEGSSASRSAEESCWISSAKKTRRKNRAYSSCLEHAFMIWFRSANSYTGPQLHRCTIRDRTDGSIRLRADLLQKSLASRGGPQMSTQPSSAVVA
jgi:hypothetical protein